jgi:1,4-alpha-glucan branching enzyme
MITKLPSTQEGHACITFSLPFSIEAEWVNLVGEFNGWDTQATPFERQHLGPHWQVTLTLATGRRYRFRYLINDQEWLNDLHADDYAQNPYGSYDSVLDLTEFAGVCTRLLTPGPYPTPGETVKWVG